MSPEKKYFAPRSPGTLIHMLSSNFVSLITSTMSHKYSLTRNPLPILAILSLPLFSYPCVLSNFASHSSPLLSPMNLQSPLHQGRAYLLVRLVLAFCALPWRIHMRSMILLSAFLVSLCTLLLSIVPSPSFLLLFSLLLPFFPFPFPVVVFLFRLRRYW